MLIRRRNLPLNCCGGLVHCAQPGLNHLRNYAVTEQHSSNDAGDSKADAIATIIAFTCLVAMAVYIVAGG